MTLSREEFISRIAPMLATLAGKDVNDSEVLACANAIAELVIRNE